MEPRLGEERRTLIAEWLQRHGAVTIGDLQSRFRVSPMTARRDLSILAERGMARRTHGGAVLPLLAAHENSFAHRLRDATEAKARLAEAVFGHLRSGETVFLDASSTTYFLARLIAEHGLAVRVLTNSLPVLQVLSDSDAELVALGGTFRRVNCSFVGPTAVSAARSYFADRLIMSVTGITPDGIMTDVDLLEAEVKRTMLEQSAESVLLVDGSKLLARGQQAIASVSAVTSILADGLPRDAVARLSKGGPLVHTT